MAVPNGEARLLDPRSGIMYVNSNEMAWIVRMREVGVKMAKKAIQDSPWPRSIVLVVMGVSSKVGRDSRVANRKDRLSVDSIATIIKSGRGAHAWMPNLNDNEIRAISNFISGISEETDHRVEETSAKVPYAVAGFGRFKDDRGFPVVKPPWGTLNAIDLNSGEYLWTIPLGHEEQLKDPNIPISGTENYGGPVITAGGVLFIAATKDEKIRAFI